MQSNSIVSADILQRFANIVGNAHVLIEPAAMAGFLDERRGRFPGRAACVLRPRTREEVAGLVAIAAETGLGLVPQGGNTGLVGAGVSYENGDAIILSLSRLNRLRELDPLNNSMTVEAGMTLKTAQENAEKADRLFPLSMASEGSCEIGGNLATNAGGNAVLHYGTMRDLVLGLEVVLADGSLWNGLKLLRKENTGYDLKQLFIGSEGTLGIITAATLKLFARPRAVRTAFLAVPYIKEAVEFLRLTSSECGELITSFELISEQAMKFLMAHLPDAQRPLKHSCEWYVLMELSAGGDDAVLGENLESVLALGLEWNLLTDAVVAKSGAQRLQFWRLREAISDIQKYEGASIKHDISVPITKIAEFVDKATKAACLFEPGCRPVVFGHLGDGNIHFNVSQPVGMEGEKFLARWNDLNRIIHDIAHEMGGSFSAEHGVGRFKRDDFIRYKSPTEIALMKSLKTVFDPKNILNPGVFWS
jgi:FAD/FMN-containing dehydrogenase